MPGPTPRFLVTAGNTREKIDRVRDWGNIFTGNTGFSIARALAGLGEVHLLTSNRVHVEQLRRETSQPPIGTETFTSHDDLTAALVRHFAAGAFDAVFMTAAVADYCPVGVYRVIDRRQNADGTETWGVRNVQAGKVKSDHPAIAVLGARTEKIVDLFRSRWNHRGLLFKFKLEVGVSGEELIRIGQASRAASGADYLVANTLEMVEGPAAGAYLLSEQGARFVPRDQLAVTLRDVVKAHLNL